MNIRRLVLLFVSLTCWPAVAAAQPAKAEIIKLQKDFRLAVSRDFEVLRDRIVAHEDKWRGGPFMLFHVRPRESGIYNLKYTYRMRDDFYYEGENEIVIRVGARKCDRELQAEDWKTMYCLGDTIVIPVRLSDSSSFKFTLESEYLKAITRTGGERPAFLGILDKQKVANPLEANLTYYGFDRSDQMSRSATGGGTIFHKAVFEAKRAGRFNLGLSSDDKPDLQGILKPRMDAVPVIIVDPGTPVTALLTHEKVTGFTKGRAYSSTNLVSYQTNLLILQPGDFISPIYSMYIIPRSDGSAAGRYNVPDKDPLPVIKKLPFSLKKAGSYNDWLNGYLVF